MRVTMKRNPSTTGVTTTVLLATAFAMGCAAETGDETAPNTANLAANAAPVDDGGVRCGGRIKTDRKLNKDLSCDCTSAAALTVVGPARLDLDDHTVSCHSGDEDDKPVIDLIGNGARLANGSVSHYGVDRPGVCVQVRGDDHGVFDVITSQCFTCIRVIGNRNKVKNCDATRSPETGIAVRGNGNRVEHNFVKYAGESGVVACGKNNRIGNNLVKNPGDGIYISASCGASDGTEVVGNRVKYSDYDGIHIGANKCVVKGNLSEDSGDSGIGVRGSGNILSGNTAKGSRRFDLFDSSEDCDNTWEDNEYDTSARRTKDFDYITDPACIE
jgi:hypothetical protein